MSYNLGIQSIDKQILESIYECNKRGNILYWVLLYVNNFVTEGFGF